MRTDSGNLSASTLFNLSIVATCFSFVPFLAPIGVQFWLLSATLHAADARTRPVARVRAPLRSGTPLAQP